MEEGFEPVYDGESVLLILGSFPSVKSRAEGFYYGNPQNRFWRTVCGFFGEEMPKSVREKREFLQRRHIALWDVVMQCEIVGSADADIRAEKTADLLSLTAKCPNLVAIYCNGRKAYSLLCEHFPALVPKTKLLPSTSPANPRFSPAVWEEALRQVFGGSSANFPKTVDNGEEMR